MLKLLKIKKGPDFYSSRSHRWIKNDSLIKRCFDLYLENKSQVIRNFERKHGLIEFIPASAKLGCSLMTQKKIPLILIFPDLIQIMKSASPERALGVLFHEIGHLVNEHSFKDISPLQAQIEADFFAYKHGFGVALQEVLLDYEEDINCKVRIARLSQEYYKNFKKAS